jgi:O-antigen/teichoic acid export membrane protein
VHRDPALVGALVFLTRTFPSAAYGRYAVVISTVTVLSTLCYGWLEQATLRYEPDDDTEIRNVVVANVSVISLSILLVGIAGYGVVADRLGAYEPFYFATLAALVVQGMFRTTRVVLQARLDSQFVSVLDIGRSALTFLFGAVLAVFVLESIVGWLWGTALGIACLLVLTSRRAGGSFVPELNRPLAVRMLLFGVPMIGWLLGQTLLSFADRLLLELLRGSASVGAYAAHYTIASRSVLLVLAPVVQAAHPILMDTWTGNNEAEMSEQLTSMTRYVLLMGLPATVGLGFVGEPLSRLLLGSSYSVSPMVIPLVATGLFIWNLGMIGHKPLELREETRLMLVGVVIAVALNIALNLPLITAFGPTGAAVATLVSFLSYPIFIQAVSDTSVEWRLPRGTLVNVGTGLLVMAIPFAVVLYTGVYPGVATVALVPLCATLYVATLYWRNEFTPSEKQMIQRTIRGR